MRISFEGLDLECEVTIVDGCRGVSDAERGMCVPPTPDIVSLESIYEGGNDITWLIHGLGNDLFQKIEEVCQEKQDELF